MDTIGKRIRAVLNWRGVQVNDAAKEIGISRTQLTKWAYDKVQNPDINVLGRFAKFSDVNLDWLYTGDGPAPDLGPKEDPIPDDTVIKAVVQRIPKTGPFSVEDRITLLRMLVIAFQFTFGSDGDIEISKKQP